MRQLQRQNNAPGIGIEIYTDIDITAHLHPNQSGKVYMQKVE
jgi:hypothetical protein